MNSVKILHCADIHIGAAESFLKTNADSRRIETLLTFENIANTEHLPYLKFAKKIAMESNAITAEQHLKVMEIFLKYRFSNEALSESEISFIKNAVKEYRKNSTKGRSLEDKFQFMFIDNLG